MDGCPSCAAFYCYDNSSIMKRFKGDFCHSDKRKVVFHLKRFLLCVMHLCMHDTARMLAGRLGVFISFDNQAFTNF